jgi:hypothetical protein
MREGAWECCLGLWYLAGVRFLNTVGVRAAVWDGMISLSCLCWRFLLFAAFHPLPFSGTVMGVLELIF